MYNGPGPARANPFDGKGAREELLIDRTAKFETECVAATDGHALERAVDLLRQGHVVAFPTDTVYGVGVHALQEQAVARLFVAKQRPMEQAIPLLLADAEALDQVCVDIPSAAWELARRFWPGALSLVLWRGPAVPSVVAGGGATVAVRVPDHALVRDLCRRVPGPLATSSANLHGQPPAITAGDVRHGLRGRIPLILDGGPCTGGLSSTVVDLTVQPAAIVRSGPISARQLASVVAVRD
jgi:L-threonylcarbamoyladenylate synthase